MCVYVLRSRPQRLGYSTKSTINIHHRLLLLLLLLPFRQLASHHTSRYTFDFRLHLPDHLPDQLLLLLLLRRDLTELRDDDDDEVLLLRKGLLRHRPHM